MNHPSGGNPLRKTHYRSLKNYQEAQHQMEEIDKFRWKRQPKLRLDRALKS